LLLIRSAAAATAADDVQLVDEDDRGRGRPRLGEQVAHPRSAHAHGHLDELGRRDAEEGHARLSRHRPGQQGLPVPGGPTSSTPFGTALPRRWYRPGWRRKSTTSWSSCSASSMPATSLNVVAGRSAS
jgi:hypothetical protein